MAQSEKTRAYWRRRALTQKLRERGNLTAYDRMTHDELWEALCRDLHGLVFELEGHALPDMYAQALRATEFAVELMTRGQQLQLEV
jgi:hypothetical protein